MGPNQTEYMTAISAEQWHFVTQDNLTAREAVTFLKEGMRLRSFRDNLFAVLGTDDVETQLVQRLFEYAQLTSEKTPQEDSIRRKVRNWMSGANLPTDREDVFRICFALELDEAKAERLLTRLTEQGIHYRSGREMVYAYCLKYQLGYGAALRLIAEFVEKKPADNNPAMMTRVIESEFRSIQATEDLIDFILRNKSNLGEGHNTAYSYFAKMLALLVGDEDEGSYSMEYVAETYLRLGVPLDKKTAGYTDIQKVVKKYWPGARSIKAMKARTEDVTRKTLLLLYLVTGGVWGQEYDELYEDYITPEQFLEEHCRRMNRMLTECGMCRIDPRNVFDYLLLYCLRPEDETFMSERMEMLAAEIFAAD